MTDKEIDQTLKLIARGNSLYEIPNPQLDDEVLERLMKDGLIKRNGEGGFFLTEYGEIIAVMGYKTHQKQKKRYKSAEKEIFKHWILFVMILLILITGGVIMIM